MCEKCGSEYEWRSKACKKVTTGKHKQELVVADKTGSTTPAHYHVVSDLKGVSLQQPSLRDARLNRCTVKGVQQLEIVISSTYKVVIEPLVIIKL